jgi:hypothetical protein
MLEIKIDLDKELRDPIFIAGLPGMGLTGKQSVDYLINKLNAEKISVVRTPFLGVPAISIHNGLVEDIPEEIYSFFYADLNGRDILLFTSQSQPATPEWQHMVAMKAIEKIKEFDVGIIYTLAATPIPHFKEEVDVYGVATTRDLVEMLRLNGVKPLSGEGAISGINGLLLGYGKKAGIDGICLLGETYLVSGMDRIAPLAVLRALSRILKVDIDLSRMEKEAEEFKDQVSQVMKRSYKEGVDEDKPKYIY